MVIYFTKTAIGYSHIKENKICQDYSASYHSEECTIITACDGHGGDIYIRSDKGSKFASDATIKVLKKIASTDFAKFTDKKSCDKIKLQILCEWNNLVAEHLSENEITQQEIAHLSEDQAFKLSLTPEQAYGTTINGAMVIGDKLICVSIGDGGVFVIKGGEIHPVFDDDEDSVANLTHSMCQENVYKYLNVEIVDFSELDGVLVCTDGLINPYQNLDNFNEKLVKPVCEKLLDGKDKDVEEFVVELGEKIGIGDDVSLGIAIKI